jgi:hypothetical protein
LQTIDTIAKHKNLSTHKNKAYTKKQGVNTSCFLEETAILDLF